MAFREKSAWITLGALTLVFGFYFATLLTRYNATASLSRLEPLEQIKGPVSSLPSAGPALLNPTHPTELILPVFLPALAALIVLMALSHAAIAILSPRDANAPMDERERRYDREAASAGFFVLMAGVMIAASGVFFGIGSFWMANAILLSAVLAEIVRLLTTILAYRRGT